jgi:hypothetical protein
MNKYRIDRGVAVQKHKIHPNPWNPNKTTDRQQQAIEESLDYFGQVIEILVRPHPEDREQYQVIDGEHRLSQLDDMVYVNVIHDLADAEAKKLTIIMNETRGQADKVDLAVLLADIQSDLGDLTGLGLPYSDNELDELIKLANVDWDQISADDNEENESSENQNESSESPQLTNLFIKIDPATLDRFKQARDLVDNPSPDPAIAWGQTIDLMLQDFLAQA